jgi:2-polyprenyl-3-methyl-5-hydroxy-6-metoxy-1,4-benzoquinol methylase
MRPIGGGRSACRKCGFFASYEKPGARAEVESLGAVREKKFRLICRAIKEKFPQTKTILDVGSSTGHFLKTAADEVFSATGLEPDARLADSARAQGCDVIDGFFPSAGSLSARTYDAIIFNDSFEHIPSLQEVLQGIKKHLKSTGVVIINLPTSDGIIFKAAFF